MKNESKHIKLKVIISYMAIILLSIYAVQIVFQKISELRASESGRDDSNRKLYLISHTMTLLYEAESASSAFVLTGNNQYLKNYESLIQEVYTHIDSLKSYSSQPSQQLRIDSIHLLMRKKMSNIREINRARQTISNDEFYQKAIKSIENECETTVDQLFFDTKVITKYDTIYDINARTVKRFWSTKVEYDTVMRVSKSEELVIDTLSNTIPTHNPDSTISKFQQLWKEKQKKEDVVKSQINKKELVLIKQSATITRQLRRIISGYEKDEIIAAISKEHRRSRIFDNTIHMMYLVAIAAGLIILTFLFFILRDISRGQRYRKQLEQANAYADSLLDNREKMMLTVTHDIKSPLSSVLGYIELISSTTVNERQRYFLHNMKGSAEHILQLVTNLLDFSKLDSNKMLKQEVAFNVASLCNEIYATYMPLAMQKKLRLEKKINEQVDKRFFGDALRIRQIVSNILSNAVKYTQKGFVRFAVTYSCTEHVLTISIKDTGPGMTEEEQKLIFKEFTRLTKSASIEGSGLGLTITLKLIHLLGGNIRLKSNPGKGSCFIIKLPLNYAEQPNATVQTDEKPTVGEITRPIGNIHILVVDDDKVQLDMTSEMLRRIGVKVTSTTDSQNAVKLLQKNTFNLVFSDIQMPLLDGFGLIKHIHKISNIPVIAVTATTETQNKMYESVGFTSYLAKPFTSKDLIQIIVKYCGVKIDIAPEKKIEIPEKSNGYTLKNIMQFADNDQNMVNQFIESFVKETKQNCASLQEAVNANDLMQCSALGHKMLAMFRQLEAKNITILLEQIEQHRNHPIRHEEMKRLINTTCLMIDDLLRCLSKKP